MRRLAPRASWAALLAISAGCPGGGGSKADDPPEITLADILPGPWLYLGGSIVQRCDSGTENAPLAGSGVAFSMSADAARVNWTAGPCRLQLAGAADDPTSVGYAGGTCSWTGTLADGRPFEATATPGAWTFRVNVNAATLSEEGAWSIAYVSQGQTLRCAVTITGVLQPGVGGGPPEIPVPTMAPTCRNSSYPKYCSSDGGCWTASTDCSLPVLSCGGDQWRCSDASRYASCCAGALHTCASTHPYYCPADGYCHATASECSASCDYRARACR